MILPLMDSSIILIILIRCNSSMKTDCSVGYNSKFSYEKISSRSNGVFSTGQE